MMNKIFRIFMLGGVTDKQYIRYIELIGGHDNE